MASSASPWASMRRRAVTNDITETTISSHPHAEDRGESAHDSERCRALLMKLVREVMAFVRQQQQQQSHNDATSTLWMNAVSRICENRLEQLQHSSCGLSSLSPDPAAASPREVIAEAMVHELLASVAEIRLAETETMVLEEVENVETLRRLRVSLQQDEAELRRIVREGAGEDVRLMELQRLLRVAFLQELASSKAQGLADSLHHEASLQFAWETIQEQKKEIVRLRAENEQLQSAMPAAPPSRQPGNEEPRHAIHQLQLQLSSHPDSNLRILQDQVAQLEATLNQHDSMRRHGSRFPSRRSLSGVTMSSSRDDDDERSSRSISHRDSVLLTSHLTTSALRECDQCRRHTRTLVECQSELKQLRAQGAADEDALVRAEKDHSHMKKELVALTSALLASKQQQEELRQMVTNITDDKLQVQTTQEAQRQNHDRHLEVLKRQLRELEVWRERSDQERQSHQQIQDALESELQRVKQINASLERERDGLSVEIKKLTKEGEEVKTDWMVDKAKCVEFQNALAAVDDELRTTQKEMKTALDQIKQHESALDRMKRQCEQSSTSAEASALRIRDLEAQLRDSAMSLKRLQESSTSSVLRITTLERELSHRDISVTKYAQQVRDERSRQQELGHQLKEMRQSLHHRQQYVAELEGRLDRSEEKRSVQSQQLEEAQIRIQQAEDQAVALKSDLQLQYEECQRLELKLADSQAQAARLEHELMEKNNAAARLQASVDKQSQEQEGVELSSRNHIDGLTHELSETKTTILMWMSKYHAVVNEKTRLAEELEQALDAGSRADAAADQVRESFRVLAEDKQKLLVEFDKLMQKLHRCENENQVLTTDSVGLKAQVAVMERDCSHLTRELDHTTAELQALQSRSGDQLVEIGVLKADKNVVMKELATASQRYHDLQAQVVDLESSHSHEVSALVDRHQQALAIAWTQVERLELGHVAAMNDVTQKLEEQLKGFDLRLQCVTSAVQRAVTKQKQSNLVRQMAFPASDADKTPPCSCLDRSWSAENRAIGDTRSSCTQTTLQLGVADEVEVRRSIKKVQCVENEATLLHGPSTDSMDGSMSPHRQTRRSLEGYAMRDDGEAYLHQTTELRDQSVLSPSAAAGSANIEETVRPTADDPIDIVGTDRRPSSSTKLKSEAEESQLAESEYVDPVASVPAAYSEQIRCQEVDRGLCDANTIALEMEETIVPALFHKHDVTTDTERCDSDRSAPGSEMRQRVFDQIAVQFLTAEFVIATEWERVERIMSSTAKRLDSVAGRAVDSVDAWTQHRRLKRVRERCSLADASSQTKRVWMDDAMSQTESFVSVTRATSTDDELFQHAVQPVIDGLGLTPATVETVVEATGRSQSSTRSAAVSNTTITGRDGSLHIDLEAPQLEALKISTTRRASVTRPNRVQVMRKSAAKFRTTSRARRSVVVLQQASKTQEKQEIVLNPATHATQLMVDAQVQTTRTLTDAVAFKWALLTTKVIRRATWRGFVTCLTENQQYAYCQNLVAQRFAMLTWRLLARHHTSGLLSILSSKIQPIKTENKRLIQDAREKRTTMRWESMVRSTLWSVNGTKPMRLVVRTLMKRMKKRQASVAAQLQWHAFRWQLESQTHERTATQIWLKHLTLYRRGEVEKRLRRHFVAWHGLARGLISVSRLSQTDHEDQGIQYHSVVGDATSRRRPANVSTSLQVVMRECVTLLRQWCGEHRIEKTDVQQYHHHHGHHEHHDHASHNYPLESPLFANSSSQVQSSGCSTGTVNIELLIRLLLQSSDQVGQWRDAMDKKLEEMKIRETQLERLESHCTELQQIIDKYHERHARAHAVTEHHVREHQYRTGHRVHHVQTPVLQRLETDRLRVLEAERRQLNQRNIAMLEGVIVQLHDAKQSRVELHERLERKTKQLVRVQRHNHGLYIHIVLLRAFYQWRCKASRLSSPPDPGS